MADRPFVTLPADQPSYETLTELTMQQKAELPARFHTPAFSDAQPPLFLCRVCWDGETSQITEWPCASALKAGWDVFGPDRELGEPLGLPAISISHEVLEAAARQIHTGYDRAAPVERSDAREIVRDALLGAAVAFQHPPEGGAAWTS